MIYFDCAHARTQLAGAFRILFPYYPAEEFSAMILSLATSPYFTIYRQAAYGIHSN